MRKQIYLPLANRYEELKYSTLVLSVLIEFAIIVVLGFSWGKHCQNVFCLSHLHVCNNKINRKTDKLLSHYTTKKGFQLIQVIQQSVTPVAPVYPVPGCTHNFTSWARSWQAPQTLTVQGLEFLLALLVAEQFLHVIRVQLVFPISLICCPDIVLSYHAVFWKGFPVEITHPGAPARPLANEACAI